VKQKTGIEFDIATVESTAGQDIFDFSRQLAMDWNIGARTSSQKKFVAGPGYQGKDVVHAVLAIGAKRPA